MTVNLLAINVGNTRTQVGAFADGKLIEQRRVPHGEAEQLQNALRELWQKIEGEEDPAVYLASVNEATCERICAIAADTLPVKPVRMERDIIIPIGRGVDPEAIVGEDRLLDAAAAYDTLKQACIVVDAGTALTVNFVDGEGTFHGGAILPGAQMMLDALHARTGMLPEVKFDVPQEPVGHNTQQAMLTGAFHGLRGAVRELVEKFAEVYGAYPKVIATGGDAQALFGEYELIDTIVPELTLLGMVVARRHALEAE